jgi:predicted nucleotidyltransferase
MSFVSSVPPFVEALTMPETTGKTPWDDLLTGFGSSTTEIESRRKLRRLFDQATRIDPIKSRSELYESLAELLGTGTNDRFALYCPLYLVPDADWHRQYGEPVDNFMEAFIASWFRMLSVQDIRANFVDGDVPDIEQGKESLDMVIQAAYLAPYLAEKGLISLQQLPPDELLTKNLQHALNKPERTIQPWSGTTDLSHHVAVELHDSYEYGGVSEKRAKWLKWDRRRRRIGHIGKSLAPLLIKGFDIRLGDLDNDASEAVIIGMGAAIEQMWFDGEEPHKIDALCDKFKVTLSQWFRNDYLRDTVTSVLCRLHSIGFVKKRFLDDHGIFYPTLEGPLHQNLSAVEPEREEIRRALHDPEVLEIIYPAAIVFGSRLKGYGGLDSDVDVAVFIRPDTTFTSNFGPFLREKFGRDVVEYWLVEDGPDLRVYDFPKLAANVGDSTNVHVLLGGAWEGELATISMLGERLLMPYLRETNEAVRDVWLREMERDLLQYRLLHRGYERFHVPRDDVFLDDGYRMTASTLYASHVFIPHSK